MLASAGPSAGVACVLTAQCVLEVSDLALVQGTDSQTVTTVANIYSTVQPINTKQVLFMLPGRFPII